MAPKRRKPAPGQMRLLTKKERELLRVKSLSALMCGTDTSWEVRDKDQKVIEVCEDRRDLVEAFWKRDTHAWKDPL